MYQLTVGIIADEKMRCREMCTGMDFIHKWTRVFVCVTRPISSAPKYGHIGQPQTPWRKWKRERYRKRGEERRRAKVAAEGTQTPPQRFVLVFAKPPRYSALSHKPVCRNYFQRHVKTTRLRVVLLALARPAVLSPFLSFSCSPSVSFLYFSFWLLSLFLPPVFSFVFLFLASHSLVSPLMTFYFSFS